MAEPPPREPLSRRIERVLGLLRAAAKLAAPQEPLGLRARTLLPATSGLSPESVELALSQHLETSASVAALKALCADAPATPTAHVLLSSNVVTAPLRAIAVALASSPRVVVRASRREPEFAQLLAEASGGAFGLVDQLAPLPGDHVWAYGSDATLRAVAGELPAGVVFHAYGSGLGAALIELTPGSSAGQLQRVARELARDVSVFDQRGCLSPRVALVKGSDDAVLQLARALAAQLAKEEYHYPRGELAPEELAAAVRFRDTMLYSGELLPAGKGSVGVALRAEQLTIAPVGRHLQLMAVTDFQPWLAQLAPHLTALGVSGSAELEASLSRDFPRVRLTALGKMQRPPLDGPVDRRIPVQGRVL